MRARTLCLLVLPFAACTGGDKGQSPTPSAAEPTPSAPTAAAAPTPAAERDGYILYTASMVKQATDDAGVKNNWLASLYRGEQITILETQGEFTKVRASDGKEGYIKAAAVLDGQGVTAATVLDVVKTFARPDFLAPSKTVIAPGSLLYVVKKSKDDTFAEVNYRGTQTLWLEAGRLNADAKEVAAARIVSRARSLDEAKDAKSVEQAKQYWDVAKSQFGDTQVVQKALAPAAPTEGAAAEAPTENPAAPTPAAPPPAPQGN